MSNTLKNEPLIDYKIESFGPTNYAIGWNKDGARFHVWFTDSVVEDTIYKNPPHGTKCHAEGWFETRRLDLTAKKHAELCEFLHAIPADEYVTAEAIRSAAIQARKDDRNAETVKRVKIALRTEAETLIAEGSNRASFTLLQFMESATDEQLLRFARMS